MALKKDSNRTPITATVKKDTANALKKIAKDNDTSVGKVLDELIDTGTVRDLDNLALKATTQEEANTVFNRYYARRLTTDDMPLSFLEKWYPRAYKDYMETL